MRLAAFGHMLCFLNCHLPAHMDKAEQRKDNFQTILSLQQFPGPGAHGILDHEYGLWAGPNGAWAGLVKERWASESRTLGSWNLSTTSLGGPCRERQSLCGVGGPPNYIKEHDCW